MSCRHKAVKFVDSNQRENLYDFRYRNDSSDTTSEVQPMKSN